MTISARQIAVLHVAKHQLGLSDAAYRELLHQAAGVRSAKELDAAGFEAALERLAALGFRTRLPARGLGDRPGMASPAQVDYIVRMWRAYLGRDDETALNHWLEHKFGVTALRFVDRHAANQAITALKAMTARSRADA